MWFAMLAGSKTRCEFRERLVVVVLSGVGMDGVSDWRFVAAIFLAPLAAVGVETIFFTIDLPSINFAAFLFVMMLGYAVAFLHMLILGAPLFLVLGRRWRLRWRNAALCGGLVGAAPIAVLVFPDTFSALVAVCACSGAAAGLAFRAVIGAPRETQ